MNDKDEYLVYIKNNGTRFYYKNKLLHREAGPAIVIPEEISQYTNLSDEELYIKTTTPIISKAANRDFRLKHSENGNLEIVNNPLSDFFFSHYYLEDQKYDEKMWKSLMEKKKLNQELSNGLTKTGTQSKKPKI